MGTGPYTVSMVINRNAYKLDLPKTIRNNNVFHLSQLDHYAPLIVGQQCSDNIQWLLMIWRNGRSKWFWTLSSVTDSHTTLSSGLGPTTHSSAETRSKSSRMLTNWSKSSTETIRTNHRCEAIRNLEVEELTEWRYGGWGHLGISFLLFRLLKPGPGQMLLTWVSPPPESRQLEVKFPRAAEGRPEWYCSVVGLMRSYKSVCVLFPWILPLLGNLGVLP